MAACCLDTRNVSGLPGIPPIEHDKAWAIISVEKLCVKVIDEVRCGGRAHSLPHRRRYLRFHVHRCGFAHHAASLTSFEIARREIQVWKSRTIPLPKTSNPLKEWRRGVKIFPWLSLLTRRELVIPATSAHLSAFFLHRVTP